MDEQQKMEASRIYKLSVKLTHRFLAWVGCKRQRVISLDLKYIDG